MNDSHTATRSASSQEAAPETAGHRDSDTTSGRLSPDQAQPSATGEPPGNAAAAPPPFAPHQLMASRFLLLWPVAQLVKWWNRTLRFEISEEERAVVMDTSEPTVIILWHNRILLTPEIYRRYRSGRTVTGLVSASKDGAWLAAFFRLVGIGSVRGSSSRRSLAATREMIARMREGSDIGITPDGPRGPVYDFKAGAMVLARQARSPILLLAWNYRSAWRLKSWDGFYIPKPFSRVTVRCRRFESLDELDRSGAAGDLEKTGDERAQSSAALRQALLEMTEDLEQRH